MASGFRFENTDLDSVFAPRYSGWPQAGATEFEIAGYGDINQRYAPLSTGSAAANTDFRISTLADLATIFAGYGTTGVKVGTQPANVSGSAAAGNPGIVTTNTTTCSGTKGSGSYTYTWHLASGSGVSFTAPNSATTAVSGSVPAGQTISGTMYCTISDGFTSVNTSIVSWSIHNTSPPITVVPYTISATAFHPAAATSNIFFLPDGTERYQNNAQPYPYPFIGNWDPNGDGTNYDVKATLISGTAPNSPGLSNTLNTWINPTNPTFGASWGLQNASGDGNTWTCVLRIDISEHGAGISIANGTITLNARDN